MTNVMSGLSIILPKGETRDFYILNDLSTADIAKIAALGGGIYILTFLSKDISVSDDSMNVIYIGKAETNMVNRLRDHLLKFEGKSAIWKSWIDKAFVSEIGGLRRVTIGDIRVLCLPTKYPTIAENMLINVKLSYSNIPLNVTDNTFKNELYTPECLDKVNYGKHKGGFEIQGLHLEKLLDFVTRIGESVKEFWAGK